ncbi:UDP-2,3-diacylglucosamine diphosphatase [Marinomonas sp. A79]|uniref:UDP-2,3-diacylglucosamine hydrolase n=1 Tax=Marinomonas vulgaris TaxID=2823372 RepID=A0ABS5HA58_9GAMM|nr:UDP-2,3-diacylglucosamine diphosphatase [Marinomonas vulgaris]MBR7888556.1 UDP-2,3-diacylglucosamine diphosphatase [Marinomonas vulgaris]
MRRYFISDLHLSDKRPDLIRAFVQLADELIQQEQSAELYILGDFYEAWIGDDYQADWNIPIEAALKTLSDSDIALYFLHGNRDFLIGKRWVDRVGATLIQEQTRLTLDKGSLLLTHGDEYCLEDTEYQSFRQTVRSPAWQANILALPIEQRLALAAQLRNDSKTMSSEKSSAIMDVTPDAVQQSLVKNGCATVIHGHTHRPAVHKRKQQLRLVLGNWDDAIWLACIDKDIFTQSSCSVEHFLEQGIAGLTTVHKEPVLFLCD